MNEEVMKKLADDPDGLLTYEYIANHIGDCDDIMNDLVKHMTAVDRDGQFTASAARYLCAIDREHYREAIDMLVADVIDKDREHRYLAELIKGIWGDDYMHRADELNASDRNFRRIFKRLYPASSL